MPVITISRQFAAGGSMVASMVAERLGWQLVDNELIDRVAAQAGLPPQEVAAREERVPALIERIARALAISSPEVFVTTGEPAEARFDREADLVRATEAVIAETVRDTPKLILVGRGAQACLAQREDSLHIFLVAPVEDRVAAAITRLGLTRAEAKERVEEKVQEVEALVGSLQKYRIHHIPVVDDSGDLVINTGVFDYEQAAHLVVEAARMRGWG